MCPLPFAAALSLCLTASYRLLQLGLYVCRLITGLMGGKIEVDSVKGAGSTFRFFIATQTPDDKGDIGKIVEVKPIIIEFPHVLVVEDNMINSRVIQRQLKKAGMTCETAFDGKQGLDAVVKSFQTDQRRFNCVLVRPPSALVRPHFVVRLTHAITDCCRWIARCPSCRARRPCRRFAGSRLPARFPLGPLSLP